MKEKIFTRGFFFSFIAEFCSAFIFYMLITTVTEYATKFGATGSVSGLVSGIFVIGVLITRFLFSRVLQRAGWKKMMFASQAIHLLSCFAYFLINSLPMLIIVRFIHGLCYGLSSSANLSVGMSQIPRSRYGEGNGYLMTSITLAVAVGPYAGGAFLDRFGAVDCFTAVVIITVIMCISISFVKLPADSVIDASEKKEKGLNSLIEVSAIPITTCVFIIAFAYSSVLSFLRLYSKSINLDSTIGIFFLVYAAVLIITRPVAGKIQDKYGDSVIVFPCAVMQVVSHVLIAKCPTAFGITIAAILCAAGYGTLSSCISAIASRDVSLERKSYAVATYWIGNDLANGIGPVALGAVQDSLGFAPMYLCAAVIAAIVMPFYRIFCYKKSKG